MNWITGEDFQKLGEFTYAPQKKAAGDYNNLPNTLNIDLLKEGSIVYTHTVYAKYLLDIVQDQDKRVVIITHNYDWSIDETYLVPNNVIKWFAQNVNVNNSKIESIPIGLENRWWFIEIQKKEKMLNKLNSPKILRNLVYVNHDIKTNPAKRTIPYQILKNKSYATIKYGLNGQGFDEYLNDIYNHKFVICPEGNGIDTHRTWECLYMNTIPIEKRNINNQFYTDLPICFVDNWEEITEDFLEKEYVKITNSNWNLNKLNFDYWKNKICDKKQKP
jgi:hypothetical protein